MWLIIENDKNEPLSAIGLKEGETIVGSGPKSNLILRGSRISRKHLTLTRKGTKVSFRDLESQAGTFLNGKEQEEGFLKPNDCLTLDKFSLRVGPKLPTCFRSALEKDQGSTATSTDWESCTNLLNDLRQSTDQRSLLQCLLTGLISVLGAERGFVLLQESCEEQMVQVATVALDNSEELFSLSSTIYKEALKTKKTVFIKNTLDSPICAQAASLIDTKPRSILCGPLTINEKSFGVIYMDVPLLSVQLGDDALEFFQSMVDLASQLLADKETREELLLSREKFLTLADLTGENHELVSGEGEAAKQLENLMASAAPIDVSVLLQGETGVGKEVVARAIHQRSTRKEKAFIAVNCAALPLDLAEAILFGVEKGSYTGATERKIGLVELAADGTLFLDEIGDLRLDLQTVLLRVLQDKELRRVGGQKAIPVDFRLVCATNKNLEEMVREGSFRKDLFYRINVFRIGLVPLRSRKEDIIPLANHFLALFNRKFGRSIEGFTEVAANLLEKYQWPGNVRELRNAIERAVVITRTAKIEEQSFPFLTAPAQSTSQGGEGALFDTLLQRPFPEAQKLFEQMYLQRVLDGNNGKVAAAARQAGVSRGFIYNRLDKDGVVKG